ncbi:MAG: hypothetical protein HYR90_03395 [Candidatus Andersenbacteria bacterium]|nr:hypothetical protein [Candidatus Andersenbacteria bacterium]MBI3250310.1 hypothetical protein [Candidatus Andersenbacteria bacterium]
MNQVTSVKPNLLEIRRTMLEVLDTRSKDVITRRFGLKNEQKETLEKIGKEYGITRERVRQIEANAKKTLAGLENTWKPAYESLLEIFRQYGGVMAEEHIIKAVQTRLDENISGNTIVFFLVLLPGFIEAAPSKVFGPHWRHESALHPHIEAAVLEASTILKKKGHPIPGSELLSEIRSSLNLSAQELSDDAAQAALTASISIRPTVFGQWGLSTWAETNPRGVADKAYTVLRRNSKPSHFRDITKLINEARFDQKTANAQTVHNELIKDGRFVLVGRGLYGLKEWGYMSGTVADVLEAILKKTSQPLTSDELVNKVLEQRIVKKNTILLSLQNGKRFQKTPSGYTLA